MSRNVRTVLSSINILMLFSMENPLKPGWPTTAAALLMGGTFQIFLKRRVENTKENSLDLKLSTRVKHICSTQNGAPMFCSTALLVVNTFQETQTGSITSHTDLNVFHQGFICVFIFRIQLCWQEVAQVCQFVKTGSHYTILPKSVARRLALGGPQRSSPKSSARRAWITVCDQIKDVSRALANSVTNWISSRFNIHSCRLDVQRQSSLCWIFCWMCWHKFSLRASWKPEKCFSGLSSIRVPFPWFDDDQSTIVKLHHDTQWITTPSSAHKSRCRKK